MGEGTHTHTHGQLEEPLPQRRTGVQGVVVVVGLGGFNGRVVVVGSESTPHRPLSLSLSFESPLSVPCSLRIVQLFCFGGFWCGGKGKFCWEGWWWW